MPLAGEGRRPRLHRRHRVYKLVEDTKHRPKDNLELILTQSVEGKARAELLPFGLVVFGVPCFLPCPSAVCGPFLLGGKEQLCILIRCLFSLAELGVRGDLVSVKKSVGRNQLLPQGLAVYASPENRKLFEEEKLVSSREGRGTRRNTTFRFPLTTSLP